MDQTLIPVFTIQKFPAQYCAKVVIWKVWKWKYIELYYATLTRGGACGGGGGVRFKNEQQQIIDSWFKVTATFILTRHGFNSPGRLLNLYMFSYLKYGPLNNILQFIKFKPCVLNIKNWRRNCYMLGVLTKRIFVLFSREPFLDGPPPSYQFCTCNSYLTLGFSWSCGRSVRPVLARLSRSARPPSLS